MTAQALSKQTQTVVFWHFGALFLQMVVDTLLLSDYWPNFAPNSLFHSTRPIFTSVTTPWCMGMLFRNILLSLTSGTPETTSLTCLGTVPGTGANGQNTRNFSDFGYAKVRFFVRSSFRPNFRIFCFFVSFFSPFFVRVCRFCPC